MIQAPWGGPSGIVHGWVPAGGDEQRGYVPVCYPNGAHPGWLAGGYGPVMGHDRKDLRVTRQPITCRRCLKRLGRRVRVVVTRTVEPTPEGS